MVIVRGRAHGRQSSCESKTEEGEKRGGDEFLWPRSSPNAACVRAATVLVPVHSGSAVTSTMSANAPADSSAPITWKFIRRTFTTQERTRDLLAPELERSLAQADFERAVHFLPGSHRYWPVRSHSKPPRLTQGTLTTAR